MQLTAALQGHPLGFLAAALCFEGLGLPLPGELMVVAAAISAAREGHSLTAVAASAIAGVALGDHLAYWIGRKGGRFLIDCYCRAAQASKGCQVKIRALNEHWGPWALTLSRFLPGIRALTCPVAGASGMPWTRFAAYELMGTALWSLALVAASAEFGRPLSRFMELIQGFGIGATALFVFVAAISWARRELRKRREGALSPAEIDGAQAAQMNGPI